MRIPNMRKFKFTDYDHRQYEVRDLGKAEPMEDYKILYDDMNEKQKIKYVKDIKRMIRSSLEYKNFIQFLKEELDMNECTFFSEINTKKRNIRIEIHHEPFTITDLINIAIKYFIDNDIEIDDFEIAEFVMRWHYYGLIGLIPLSKTVHELVHDGKIFIPFSFPFGDIGTFYKLYNKYMSDNLKSTIKQIMEQSVKFENNPPEVLRKRFVYLKVDGFELPDADCF